ncbi:iron-siderophore ABC transporter substrate-binding protein [Alcaligenaceae bacterium C4P045]|nr:iron-siderophore ABC transporter substrate-binding protein [Alcaligenaceae bacterium C4P045]
MCRYDSPPPSALRTRRRVLQALACSLAGPGLIAGASAANTREIVHALGRTQVPLNAARVITLFQGATDTAVSLGVTPIGVVESWTQKPVYTYLRPALEGVAQVGLETQPSLEDVISLEPDLIVASRFRNERIYSLLSRIAPTIAVEDVFSFRDTLAMMGQALGKTAEAARVMAAWDARVAALRDALRTRFDLLWPLTVSVLDFREDHVRAYLPNSFSGSVLAQLGFARTALQANATQTLQKITSREAIPFLDAQVFFVLMRSDRPAVRQNYLAWRAHPLWTRLDAPRHGRVYEVDNVAWSLSGGILGAQLMLDDVAVKLALPT